MYICVYIYIYIYIEEGWGRGERGEGPTQRPARAADMYVSK